MDELSNPANTREFMAMWNAVTAEHLTHKLTGVLQQLGERVPNAPTFGEGPGRGPLAAAHPGLSGRGVPGGRSARGGPVPRRVRGRAYRLNGTRLARHA